MTKEIPNPAEEVSPWNRGWRLGIVWGSVVTLVYIAGVVTATILQSIGAN